MATRASVTVTIFLPHQAPSNPGLIASFLSNANANPTSIPTPFDNSGKYFPQKSSNARGQFFSFQTSDTLRRAASATSLALLVACVFYPSHGKKEILNGTLVSEAFIPQITDLARQVLQPLCLSNVSSRFHCRDLHHKTTS